MNRKHLFAACCLALFSYGLYAIVLQSTVYAICEYFTVPEAWLGVAVAIHAAGMLTCGLISSELSERVGKRKLVLIGASVMFCGSVLLTVAGNMYMAAAGIFMLGLGYGVNENVFTAFVVEVYEGRSAFVVNSVQVCFCVGALLAPVGVEWMMRQQLPWQLIMALPVAMYTPAFLALLFSPVRERPRVQQPSGLISVQLLKRPVMRLSVLIMALYVGQETCVSVWGSGFLQVFGVDSANGALAVSLFWAAMIPGRAWAAFRKSEPERVLTEHILLAAVGAAMALLLPGYWKIAAFVVLGLGNSAIWTSLFGVAEKVASDYSGAAFSMLGMAGCAGLILMPSAMGVVAAESKTLPMVIILAILLLLLALMRMVSVRLRDVKKQNGRDNPQDDPKNSNQNAEIGG